MDNDENGENQEGSQKEIGAAKKADKTRIPREPTRNIIVARRALR